MAVKQTTEASLAGASHSDLFCGIVLRTLLLWSLAAVSAGAGNPYVLLRMTPSDGVIVAATNLTPGLLYDVQSSTKLIDWTRITTFRAYESW